MGKDKRCVPQRRMNHSEDSQPANSPDISCALRSLQTREVSHGAEQYCHLFSLSSPPTQLHREAPSTLPCILLLACQSLFLFSIHQFNFFTPLTIYAIHHPQGLTTSTSSLVLFICLSKRKTIQLGSWDCAGTGDQKCCVQHRIYFAQVVLQK